VFTHLGWAGSQWTCNRVAVEVTPECLKYRTSVGDLWWEILSDTYANWRGAFHMRSNNSPFQFAISRILDYGVPGASFGF
jgi:hypothetical protein